jgi:hypothetical protein
MKRADKERLRELLDVLRYSDFPHEADSAWEKIMDLFQSETRTTQGSGGVSPGETERKETASGPASTDKKERVTYLLGVLKIGAREVNLGELVQFTNDLIQLYNLKGSLPSAGGAIERCPKCNGDQRGAPCAYPEACGHPCRTYIAERNQALLAAASAGRDRELAEGVLKLTKTVRYLVGIAEVGEGRPMLDDETAEQFVLRYVQRLEQELKALQSHARPSEWLKEALHNMGTHSPAMLEVLGDHLSTAQAEEVLRLTRGTRSATERSTCTLGVGCQEAGVCYAAAHGEPERCDAPQSTRYLTPGTSRNTAPLYGSDASKPGTISHTLAHHLRQAIRFITHTEAFGRQAETGILQAGNDQSTAFNVDEAKAVLRSSERTDSPDRGNA